MTTRPLFAAAVVAALGAVSAAAQQPEIPKPAPEMAQLKFFEGNWSCDGKMPPGPFGPGGAMKGSATIKSDLGGFFQSGSVKGTMTGMPPMDGMFHTTFDPVAKQFVMIWVDSMGTWAQSTSKGWEGDSMTYAGDTMMVGKKLPGRDKFTKNADGSMRHTWDLQVDGKWAPIGDETCRKAR
jgi:hypothetical protein